MNNKILIREYCCNRKGGIIKIFKFTNSKKYLINAGFINSFYEFESHWDLLVSLTKIDYIFDYIIDAKFYLMNNNKWSTIEQLKCIVYDSGDLK